MSRFGSRNVYVAFINGLDLAGMEARYLWWSILYVGVVGVGRVRHDVMPQPFTNVALGRRANRFSAPLTSILDPL